MLIYEGTKRSFSDDVECDRLSDLVEARLLEKMGLRASKNEYRSWNNSMEYMYKVLNDKDIPEDCGVAIEYNVPLTSKRVDFILSGYDPSNNGQAAIIELKQWQEVASVCDKDAIVETFVGGRPREVNHPSYQAWSYSEVIKDYNEAVQEGDISLHPCAYLHNYRSKENEPLFEKHYQSLIEKAPLFTNGEVLMLRKFLKERISKGDSQEVLERIENGDIKPSKSLQDSLAKMLKGNEEFYLLDDQKVVFEEAKKLARASNKDSKKRVLIVEGGPGTGKSVVAINLLVELIQEEMLVRYVSKNSAPREVYETKLKGDFKQKDIKALFAGSGGFMETPSNNVNVLIVDEAHRLNRKSGIYRNQGENQIKEIINAAYCSIFFIDESQRVTIHDIGSVQEIEYWANELDAEVVKTQLSSQFRCNGSDGYLAWIDDVLEIRETANKTLEDIDYEVIVFDSPDEMESRIREKNFRNKARMLAGYCWEWPTETRCDSEYKDISIGNWGISWNLSGGQPFAIGSESVNEAGCIHTVQGLEFDYAGVIIGEDMRYENGEIVTDFSKRAKSDQSLRGIKKLAAEDKEKADKIADEVIKNTYRTLMTRGMKGCYIYCVDEGLRNYMKDRIKGHFTYHITSF
ncbi:MAG: DNA/RNA helicase domain-containing protein [Raoultibacter sp.]|jgi:DNA replication protein DnaC